jgi:putative membrane protein
VKEVAALAVVLVAFVHFYFLALEMFLWKKPLGLKTFGNSLEKAEITSVLAANQGLYNGFLGAGLLVSFLFADPATAFAFQIFFLSCVLIAGIYGAWTANRKILFVQALPGVVALVLVLRSPH